MSLTQSTIRYTFLSLIKQTRFLIAAILIVLIAALVVTSLVLFYQFRVDVLTNTAVKEQENHARKVASDIETHLVSAMQLANTTAALISPLRGKQKELEMSVQVENILKRLLTSAPDETIHGIGAWFEPFVFTDDERYFGPYVRRTNSVDKTPFLTYEWTSADYNFHGQSWYLAGKEAKGQVIFIEPYFDTDLIYMTSAKAFYDESQQFIGVVTVDMVLPLLNDLIRKANLHEYEQIYVTTAKKNLFIHPEQRQLIDFARKQGKKVQSILDLTLDDLATYDATKPKIKKVKTELMVNHVNWTVHIEADYDHLLADIGGLQQSLWLGIAITLMLTTAALFALFRISYLSYLTVEEEERLAEEQLQRQKAEEELRTMHALNVELESRVEERTRELSEAYRRLKSSQTQLVQSEKMASLGQMVAGLAHEINTPLGYIRNNVEMLRRTLTRTEGLMNEYENLNNMLLGGQVDEEILGAQIGKVSEENQFFQEDEVLKEAYQLVEDTVFGVGQISDLVVNLKDFSRLDLARVENVDLNKNLDNVLVILHHKLKYKITINKQYGELPKVKCSPSQVNQVFMNIITNAAQAIESDAGVITLKTSADARYVHVTIQDNGKGISKEHLSKIFDPFFTTKPIGEGTGLGLSISHKIIQQHKGHIRVASQVGKGTKFIISLPCQTAELSTPTNTQSAAASAAEAA